MSRMVRFTLYFSFPSVFLPSGHFLCPLRFLSTFSLFVNDQHFKAATEQSVSELPGYGICWGQPYLRAHSIAPTGVLPRSLPEDDKHFQHTKTQPSKGCVSSALIPGHWGISRVLCHLKLRERVCSKNNTHRHTFSLNPWVIDEPRSWAHWLWYFQLLVCMWELWFWPYVWI